MANALQNDLFSSLISEIKTYTGKDPLLPWLRGIRRMKDSLPPQLLKEKLPRFLQKCTQTFQADRRYRNDLRYLRVWLQLMDFVDDPRALLRTMEMNRIGMKQSLFYQAYALYYEKMKKFEEAEKMYHLGVQNLAEPLDELQNSYEQFLHRMGRHKNKRIQRQEKRTSKRPLSARSIPLHSSETKENICRVDGHENVKNKKVFEESSRIVMPMKDSNHRKEVIQNVGPRSFFKQQESTETESDEPSTFCGGDTVVVKFVDTAIVGKSETENACHHGLVEPTINMKEAMNAINSMFREPLEPALVSRRSHRSRPKVDHSVNNGFEVFIDDTMDNGVGSSHQKEEKGFSLPQHSRAENCQTHQEPFKIFSDDEESSDVGGRNDEKDYFEQTEVQNSMEGSRLSALHVNAFVFLNPKELLTECSNDLDVESSFRTKLREDTVVGRFVGSTISDEPEVENVCHHGLVDPTINLKEAMDDINNMFGKPIEFVRTNRRKKQEKAQERKKDYGGFSILPDDDLKHQQGDLPPKSSGKASECDLFEPTVFTKEAIDEINKMFGMPL